VAVKPRAVLDTNVFVSGLISPQGPPAMILKALRSRLFTLVSSPPVNEEIIEVLNRPTISDRYGLGDRIFDVSFILWELAELVIDLPEVRVSSDPDDDKFLATAVAGQADYLVTGDVAELLHLHEFHAVRIVSPREFVSVLGARSERSRRSP
jgi:putative PIN family toxin of toxin-antitoxin system